MNYNKRKKKHNSSILTQLQRSYEKGKLIPFIGAGFSQNIKDYPDWEQFNEKLSELLNEDRYYLKEKVGSFEEPSMGADYYSIKQFRKKHAKKNLRKNEKDLKPIMQSAIKEILYDKIAEKDKVSSVHQLLVKCEKFPHIYTTNWDDLLEYNAKRCNKEYEVISDVTHISEIVEHQEEGKKLIIKMHGTFDDHSNIVATDTEYLDLLNDKNRPFNIKYQNDLLHYDFLFIGFGFNDSNINSLTYPINLIKKNKFERDEAPKIFMLNFSEYDPILSELLIELLGIDAFFLEVAKDYKADATIAFLNDIINEDEKTLDESVFKPNIKKDLEEEKKKLELKISLIKSHTEFDKEVKYLEYKTGKINEKLKRI